MPDARAKAHEQTAPAPQAKLIIALTIADEQGVERRSQTGLQSPQIIADGPAQAAQRRDDVERELSRTVQHCPATASNVLHLDLAANEFVRTHQHVCPRTRTSYRDVRLMLASEDCDPSLIP